MRDLLASLLFGLVSGSCDSAAYLVLDRVYTSNVTGDLLLLGADWEMHQSHGTLGRLLTVPVFAAWIWLMRLVAGTLQRRGLPALRILLLCMIGLLIAFGALAVAMAPFPGENAPATLLVALVGVLAMATLNVAARMWPALSTGSTAMTGNTVKLTMDFAELMLGEREKEPKLWKDAGRLAVTVAAFVGGCALAALAHWQVGAWCTILPLAFAVGMMVLWPEEAR